MSLGVSAMMEQHICSACLGTGVSRSTQFDGISMAYTLGTGMMDGNGTRCIQVSVLLRVLGLGITDTVMRNSASLRRQGKVD